MVPLLSEAQRPQLVGIWVVKQSCEEQTNVHLLDIVVAFMPTQSSTTSVATSAAALCATAIAFVAHTSRDSVVGSDDNIEAEQEQALCS